MVLFLSRSFLRRLDLFWKPEAKFFLVGIRNLFFFVPDLIVQTAEITPSSIDSFLRQAELTSSTQLLGFLASENLPAVPGYARVTTGGSKDPANWVSELDLYEAEDVISKKLEIKVAQE